MLVDLIREGRLLEEIDAAYAELARLNERLDAWEASHPEAARVVPWYEGREAWKAAGRPRPPWYEALRWHGERGKYAPIGFREVDQDLLNANMKRAPGRAAKKKQNDKRRNSLQ